jgi:hypothetical protein
MDGSSARKQVYATKSYLPATTCPEVSLMLRGQPYVTEIHRVPIHSMPPYNPFLDFNITEMPEPARPWEEE